MRILALPDLHHPFAHPEFLDFLRQVRRKFRTEWNVFVGDVVDEHMQSRWPKEQMAMSSTAETEAARHHLKPYRKFAPEADWILGNHDIRRLRKAQEAGIPADAFIPMSEYWGVPGWQTAERVVHDGVQYIHGDEPGCGAMGGALRYAIASGMSTVCGHVHTEAGVTWCRQAERLLFGMRVGAGYDPKAYAFNYARKNALRAIHGCGVIIDGEEAHWIPMLESN